MEIGKITSRLGGHDGKLGLRYLLDLSEILAGQILTGLRAKAVAMNNDEVKALYTVMFHRFAVYDNKSWYPNISKLLDYLFDKIDTKSSILSELVFEHLFSKDKSQQYSQKNVLEYIQS